MIELILTKGDVCLVDDDDYESLSKYRWIKSQFGYAYRLGDRRKGEKEKVLMHREILGAENGQIIDHKNGNRLDNRKENIRFATPMQNAANRSGKVSSSGYKGVMRERTKQESWLARIKVNRKLIQIGRYQTIEQAALAYNEAAIKYHGEFARLNSI